MADPSLSVTKTELDVDIADRMGYKRTSASRSAIQQARIDAARDDGVRKFYNAHTWTFLRKDTTITMTADDADEDAPDDFGHVTETFTFAADKGYSPLSQRSVGFIKASITDSDSSGVPIYYAVNAKSQTGAAGPRFEFLWYPYPDDAYVMTYTYEVQRDALTATYPYSAGTSEGRNALKWACLSEADSLYNEADREWSEGKYRDALALAIEKDSERKPSHLGPMVDNSDRGADPAGRRQRYGIWYAEIDGSVPS